MGAIVIANGDNKETRKPQFNPVQSVGPRKDFVLKEDTSGSQKEVHVVFGAKGSGKTYTSYGYVGSKHVLSFDRKSIRVKQGAYKNATNIHVYDMLQHYDPSERGMTKSSADSVDYVIFTLNEIAKKGDCDWIVIDGLERLQTMCEMKMRYEEQLGPFKAFGNLSLWKKRRMFLHQVHSAALLAAKKGIIYCTYVQVNKELEKIVDGKIVEKQKEPAWVDIIKEEADFVIYVFSEEIDGKRRWYANVESSKIPERLVEGTQDITNGWLLFVDEKGEKK